MSEKIIGIIVILGLLAIAIISAIFEIDIFAVIFIIICMCAIIAGIYSHLKSKENKKIEFYNECVKNGITAINNEKNKQRAILIADKLECNYKSDIVSFFEKSKALNAQKIENEKQEQEEKEIEKLTEQEREKFSELTRYAYKKGRDKRVAMLTDMQQELYKKADRLKKGINTIINDSQQKEHDWAIIGGITSGLAGGAAGVAAATDAQIKNIQIRQQNEKNMKSLVPAYLYVTQESSKIEEEAKNMQPLIDVAKISFVSDIPKEEVFKNLDFENVKVSISKTGAFTVRATIKVKKSVDLFDEKETVIDGTISANLYQDDKKVGNALMSLPLYGIGEPTDIEGMYLSGAALDKPYKVDFTPYELWYMER